MIHKSALVAVLVGVWAVGCEGAPRVKGSGVAKTESRVVAEFDEVELRGVGTVELRAGELTPLEVTADDNILPVLTTKVDGRKLVIEPSERIEPTTKIVIKGTVPNVKAARCDGAGDIHIQGVDNEGLALEMNGAGDIFADGKTKSLRVRINGAGDLKAEKLQAATADLDLNGAGDADVHVTDELNVRVNGAADVRYQGDPKVTKQVSGVGKITKRE